MKLVFLLHICIVGRRADKRRNKAVHLTEKSVINVTWMVIPVFYSSIIIIGPGDLLLP
jgi:heme/copper-type cytochrome/quinol oxidase subunit 2